MRVRVSARSASRRMMSTSAVTCARAVGRCTFTTTGVPSMSVAVCTCATDAAASGTSSIEANMASTSPGTSARMTSRISAHSSVVALDCRDPRALM